MKLLQLPLEIIVTILLDSDLDVRDAYAIQAINHFFGDLYKTSIRLQYDLECKVAQVTDNPGCTLSIEKRLQMLRAQEASWKSLTPTMKRSVSWPEYDCWSWQIERGHVLALGGTTDDDDVLEAVESLSVLDDFGLEPLWPGEVDGDPFQNHFIPIEDEDASYFCTCIAENDLIAVLEWGVNPEPERHRYLNELKISLFEHSTGEHHPLAEKPCISFYSVDEGVEIEENAHIQMAMEVFGENLVVTNEVHVRPGGGDLVILLLLYIYNWKTGNAKCEPIPLSNTGVIVLDHDLVLIPDNEKWTLLIYYIPPSSIGGPVKVIQRLRLPPLSDPDETNIEWGKCRCVPNPTGDGYFPKYVPPSVPFITRPESAIVNFKWEIETQDDSEIVSMIVHRHSIMNLLPSRSEWMATTSASVEPLTMDWDAWGPNIALWRYSGGRQPGLGHTATTNGQRHVYVVPETTDRKAHLVIEDFNIYNVRRCDAGQELEEEGEEYVLENQAFLRPIVSYIPCVEITSPAECKYDQVYITDGLIVGTKPVYSNDEGENKVDCDILYFGPS